MSIRIIITSLLMMSCCFLSFANTNENLLVTLDKKIEYTINSSILMLLTLSEDKPNKAEEMLANPVLTANSLNVAEQYLVLLSKANIAQFQQQHHQVIALLEQAQLLQVNIANKQLASPLFANLYQVLAVSLAATKNYEQAYLVKKSFVDEYNDYSDAERDRIVKELTQQHEITHKIETNKLLDNQNKLKALRLDEVEKKQMVQQRNFILILCTVLIFILLFLRQLKVRKKLILLTKTDNLTGLINRANMFAKGEELMKISLQKQLQLSVFLFDIDNFKHINDRFGLRVGDLVLAKVAQLVSETMRSRDIFARLDCEEFVAILPSTDVDKAKAIAVRVIEKIAHYDFSELGIENNITLSIGVANNDDTMNVFDDLLHAADLAMYQARTRGRNQMVSYRSLIKDQ